MKIDPGQAIVSQQEEKPLTESGWTKVLRNFGRGVIAGVGMIFAAIVITQFSVLGAYWFRAFWFFPIIALIGALVLGIPAGGLGGLLLGSLWKDRRAAVAGGAIAALMLTPLVFEWFSSCAFLGGC